MHRSGSAPLKKNRMKEKCKNHLIETNKQPNVNHLEVGRRRQRLRQITDDIYVRKKDIRQKKHEKKQGCEIQWLQIVV